MSFNIYKSITFTASLLMSINAFSSTGIGWFDDDLDECFEAIEEGSFLERVRSWSELDNPYTSYPIKCRINGVNYFYDEKLYSLNRVMSHPENNHHCKKLIKSSYAFCEYAKFEDVKGVRPVP